MHLRFLLDEDTERELASKLARDGHDVERVVLLDELGAGANDADIRSYARRANRIIVTDDGHDGQNSDVSGGMVKAVRTIRLIRPCRQTNAFQ